MNKTAITVREAERNFADCINRVHHQNRSFDLVKKGEPLARLVPEGEKVCAGRDLAETLAHIELSTEEALAWRKDLFTARKAPKPPEDMP